MFVVPLSAAKRGRTIKRRELTTYPAGAVYKVQPKAWLCPYSTWTPFESI
jgi:hypothetical protein